MIRYSVELTVILLAGMLVIGCSNNNKAGSYESFAEPENSLATLELGDDDLKIELFVSEPLVTDPVAMEIDEEGRIYVVEMRSYPMNASGLGRVKLLEDTTGDGIPDSYTIFADSLAFPKGIMRWKKGILVTDAPHLYYLQDTTGDGVADKKDVMLTGFARSNPQHNFNTPIYGIDNWIYLANNNTIGTETFSDLFGDRGSKVSYHGAENSPFLPQNAGGKNVRFKPDTLGLEMLASSSQFGHTFDAWGRHYLINNANHHYHEVISKKYRDRNPSLPDHNEIYNSSDHGNASDIYPITVNPEHQLLTDRGVFTSASALTWYLGGAFPNKYDNVTFAAEPVHNLVHADVVEDDGAVAKASRLIEQREFLASTDAWFRPVNFYIGPDGALYVVDYYRPIIEHPQWMDDEAINNKDLYEASNRGRIYRVVPKDMDAANWVNKLQLNDESTLQLVNHLESENIWWRRNAQRLLMDRKDLSAVEPLKELVLNSESPAARLHALWTLDGLNRLDDNIIAKGLIDEEAGVRMNAIKLAEKRIGGDSSLLKIFYEMVDDPVLKVKHQLAFTLGDLVSEQADEVREHILFKEIEDPWIQIAVLSGKSTRESELLDRAAENLSDKETQGRRLFFERLASMVGNKGGRSDISRLMRENLTDVSEKNEWWRTAILSGLAQTLQHKKIDPEDTPANSRLALNTFFETDLKRVREGAMQLLVIMGIPDKDREETIKKALVIAENHDVDDSFRADAINLISMLDPLSFEEELMNYLNPTEASPVQQAAVKGLSEIPGLHIGSFLLSKWEAMTPAVRDEVVNGLMRETERVDLLLDAVENNQVLVSSIGWNRRVALMRDTPPGSEIRERARQLLTEDPAALSEIVQEYQSSASLNGNVMDGKDVYLAQCSTCHQVRGKEGIEFGPDLGTVRHWTSQALISKILNPSRSIADGYEMWIIERFSESSIAGAIVSETGNSITVRKAGGIETTISRTDIKAITSSNVSAMPSGMSRDISKQDMADLIAYIRQI